MRGARCSGAALTRASSGIRAVGPGNRPLSNGPGPLAHRRRNPDRVRPLQGGALSALQPELRRDPTLQGKMILRLTIEPDGSVSFCELQSTDMNAPDLSAQVVERVQDVRLRREGGAGHHDPLSDRLPAGGVRRRRC